MNNRVATAEIRRITKKITTECLIEADKASKKAERPLTTTDARSIVQWYLTKQVMIESGHLLRSGPPFYTDRRLPQSDSSSPRIYELASDVEKANEPISPRDQVEDGDEPVSPSEQGTR